MSLTLTTMDLAMSTVDSHNDLVLTNSQLCNFKCCTIPPLVNSAHCGTLPSSGKLLTVLNNRAALSGDMQIKVEHLLDNSKTTGQDGVSATVLKYTATSIAPTVTRGVI